MNSSFSGEGAGGFIQAPEEPVKTDIVTTYHPQTDGSTVLKYTQDVEPVLEAIKRGEVQPWLSREREMKAVAEVPVIVFAEYARLNGILWKTAMEDPQVMKRFLADPDNSGWRIK